MPDAVERPGIRASALSLAFSIAVLAISGGLLISLVSVQHVDATSIGNSAAAAAAGVAAVALLSISAREVTSKVSAIVMSLFQPPPTSAAAIPKQLEALDKMLRSNTDQRSKFQVDAVRRKLADLRLFLALPAGWRRHDRSMIRRMYAFYTGYGFAADLERILSKLVKESTKLGLLHSTDSSFSTYEEGLDTTLSVLVDLRRSLYWLGVSSGADGFPASIRRVLQCSHPDDSLRALRDLAEGRAVTLPGGSRIAPLTGLDQHQLGTVSEHQYADVMLSLLKWGISNFPVQPCRGATHLWTSMSILDGPGGYNQRLFTSGRFFAGGVPAEVQEGGLLITPSPPLPDIVTVSKSDEPLDTDFAYVVPYLQGTADARAVIAAESTAFGWKNLCVTCACLYVDADSTQSLEESIQIDPVPTVILRGQLVDITEVEDQAQQLVDGSRPDDKIEVSKRRTHLRGQLAYTKRVVDEIGAFGHGQSISPIKSETKGSVAVFLSPEGSPDDIYALTAFHVVDHSNPGRVEHFEPVNSPLQEPRIITPGGLDILAKLVSKQKADKASAAFWLERWSTECGTAEYGRIGTNKNGWRDDWALVLLQDEWKGHNGLWMHSEDTTMMEAFTAAGARLNVAEMEGTRLDTFTGAQGVVLGASLKTGDICYKDGARTGVIAGKVEHEKVCSFIKGLSSEAVGDEVDVVQARLAVLAPLEESDCKYVALSGDSGCAVFHPSISNDAWGWVGQIVSNFNRSDGKAVALVVPQKEVLASIEEVTKTKWRLS